MVRGLSRRHLWLWFAIRLSTPYLLLLKKEHQPNENDKRFSKQWEKTEKCHAQLLLLHEVLLLR
jgi:hypothetical protein